jgi:hypothetical protein
MEGGLSAYTVQADVWSSAWKKFASAATHCSPRGYSQLMDMSLMMYDEWIELYVVFVLLQL